MDGIPCKRIYKKRMSVFMQFWVSIEIHGTQTVSEMDMTNYRNGPQSTMDHSGVVFDYIGLVLDRVANFGTSYGISEP